MKVSQHKLHRGTSTHRLFRPNLSLRHNSRHASKLASPVRRFSWAEGALIGIIAACTICIGVTLVAEATFDPKRDAENALATLADAYYIESLYPNLLGDHLNDPATILAEHTETGLPPVRLRQLLLYNNGAKANYASYFDNRFYYCDANQTTLRYYPVAPFGPHDYTITFRYACEDRRETKD